MISVDELERMWWFGGWRWIDVEFEVVLEGIDAWSYTQSRRSGCSRDVASPNVTIFSNDKSRLDLLLPGASE
jgi:hypothetical protein